MKNPELSKTKAKEKIDNFFSEKRRLNPKEIKKVKRLAMKYKIKLKEHRKRFCKRCYSDLKNGNIRITKTHKLIECKSCGKINRVQISRK